MRLRAAPMLTSATAASIVPRVLVIVVAFAAVPTRAEELAPGVTYTVEVHGGRTGHVVRVDHRVAGARIRVTANADKYKVVSDFAQSYGAIAAINGSYFDPYYPPTAAKPGKANGITMSDGRLWTDWYDGGNFSRFWGWPDGMERFGAYPNATPSPAGVTQAISGFNAVLGGVACDGSRPSVCTAVNAGAGDKTSLGVDQARNVSFLVVVKTATLAEVSRFMRDLGVWDAIHLDGGGSSQLFAKRGAVVTSRRVLNAVVVTLDGRPRVDAGTEPPDAGGALADAGTVPGDVDTELPDASTELPDAGLGDGGTVEDPPELRGGCQGCSSLSAGLSGLLLGAAWLLRWRRPRPKNLCAGRREPG